MDFFLEGAARDLFTCYSMSALARIEMDGSVEEHRPYASWLKGATGKNLEGRPRTILEDRLVCAVLFFLTEALCASGSRCQACERSPTLSKTED